MNEESIVLCGLSQRISVLSIVSAVILVAEAGCRITIYYFFCQRKAKETEELEIGGCSSVELKIASEHKVRVSFPFLFLGSNKYQHSSGQS